MSSSQHDIKIICKLVSALENVVADVKQLDGTCPHETWEEAAAALSELKASLKNGDAK